MLQVYIIISKIIANEGHTATKKGNSLFMHQIGQHLAYTV